MPMKNTHDWLRSLIMFLNLRYYCSVCSQSRDTTTSARNILGNSKPVITNVSFSHSNDQTIIQEVRDDIADLAKRFESLQHDLYTAFSSKDLTDAALSTLGSVNSVSTKTHASSGVKPVSYTAAISSNISDIVKSAVATSIRESKAIERQLQYTISMRVPMTSSMFRTSLTILDATCTWLRFLAWVASNRPRNHVF